MVVAVSIRCSLLDLLRSSSTDARLILGRHFSGPLYGRLMGLQFALLALATAGGPLLTGILRDALGRYALPPWSLSFSFWQFPLSWLPNTKGAPKLHKDV